LRKVWKNTDCWKGCERKHQPPDHSAPAQVVRLRSRFVRSRDGRGCVGGQRDDFLSHDSGHGLEAQRDEGVNQRHRTLDMRRPRHAGPGPTPNLFAIALSRIQNILFMGTAPFLVWGGGGLSNDHCTTPEPLRQISTKDGIPSKSGCTDLSL